MRKLATTADLLITQWRNKPRMRKAVQIWLDLVQEELLDPLETLRRYLSIDEAQGVWLDYIGLRLGVPRPWADTVAIPLFGFDDAGVGFDQGPMREDEPLERAVPIGDVLYRRLLRARSIALVSSGTIPELQRACAAVDHASVVTDLQTMVVRVTTGRGDDIRLADRLKCLPRAAGVALQVVAAGAHGYDDAGVAFDQGYMRS